jgi:acetylornithine aminotransferase
MTNSFLLNSYARFENSFEYGKGSRLYEKDGREFIDFTSGIGVVSVGHGNHELSTTVATQAEKLIHTSNLYNIEPQRELAKKIRDLAGYDLYSFFANSGTEANEGAIKIARKYGRRNGENRYKIITLKHSFHGRTLASLKATAQADMHHNHFGPFPDGFLYASSVEEILEIADSETAGVMIELIQGEGGVEALPVETIQNLAKELKSRGVLLMVDEVQSGVYRTGEFLASNLYGIEPDIITLAKGLGGGVPIGVVATKLHEIFSPGDHGSTFGGNLLATSSALTVLDILQREKQSGELQRKVELFEVKLNELLKEFPNIFKDLSGVGLMRGITVSEDVAVGDLVSIANSSGVLLVKSGRNRLRFLPPLTVTDSEIDEGFKRLKDGFKKAF